MWVCWYAWGKRWIPTRMMWSGLPKPLFREWRTGWRHWGVRMSRPSCCVRTIRTARWWWMPRCRYTRTSIPCINTMVSHWLLTNREVLGPRYIRIWVLWEVFISVMCIFWQTWNRGVGDLPTLYRKRWMPCTMYMEQMPCICIRRLLIGTGRTRLISCRMANGSISWTVTGYGTKPGDAMHGTVIGTVHLKWNIGTSSWVIIMVRLLPKLEIFWRHMSRVERLLRSCSAVSASRKGTGRLCCWVCLWVSWWILINILSIRDFMRVAGRRARSW